ncbi:MAG: hypothetical protein JXA23_00020, partial [Bacteroidales bacterium]|nr:hypothetical protein [Bacteroidales bacterium]
MKDSKKANRGARFFSPLAEKINRKVPIDWSTIRNRKNQQWKNQIGLQILVYKTGKVFEVHGGVF